MLLLLRVNPSSKNFYKLLLVTKKDKKKNGMIIKLIIPLNEITKSYICFKEPNFIKYYGFCISKLTKTIRISNKKRRIA